MVDRTTYSDEARTPKIALRQIFGRLGLRQELCKLAADSGLLSIEVVAMLGDTAAAVKESIKTLVDAAALGADEAARELSLMQIAAVWHACHALQTQFATRRAKMEEDPSKVPEMAQEGHAEFRGRFVRNHPDVVLLDAKEPHKKFVEKLSRDFLVHGMVPYYPASEIRTRSDAISQKTGLARTAEDLLTVSKADEPDQVTDVHTLLNRIHALFMALEYLNICGYTQELQVHFDTCKSWSSSGSIALVFPMSWLQTLSLGRRSIDFNLNRERHMVPSKKLCWRSSTTTSTCGMMLAPRLFWPRWSAKNTIQFVNQIEFNNQTLQPSRRQTRTRGSELETRSS